MPSQVHLRFNKKTLDRVPLPAAGQRATFHDTEVPGLQLRVTDRGVKSFCVFRRSKRGTPERITIGRFPTLSVERARVKAKRHLADLGEGTSVSARLRNEALEGRTLEKVHGEYLATRGVTVIAIKRKDGKLIEQPQLAPNAKLKALTARDYVKVIAKPFGDWRTKPIARITRDMVEERHHMLSQHSPVQANRAMGYLRALFVFASDYRDSKGHAVIPDNPVRRLSAKRLWNRVERRTRYVEPEQLPDWWKGFCQLAVETRKKTRQCGRRADNRTGSLIRSRAADPQFHAIV